MSSTTSVRHQMLGVLITPSFFCSRLLRDVEAMTVKVEHDVERRGVSAHATDASSTSSPVPLSP